MSSAEEDASQDPVPESLQIDEPDMDTTSLASMEVTEMDQEITQMEVESHEEVMNIESVESEETVETEVETSSVKTEEKKAIVPPLRPLNIAPKPPAKTPISIKPAAGQQIILLQGGSSGQPIKFLSSTQGLNLSNLSLAKPITFKTAPTATAAPKMKKVLMKKVAPIAKGTDTKPAQQIILVQKQDAKTPTSGTQTKTLTLAQAHQMGLLGSSKIITTSSGKQIVIGKPGGASKEVKIVQQSKLPTKILPAPQTTAKAPQRIILKPANLTPGQVLPQVIQMPTNAQPGQLHQINIPGKGVQYIKFVTATQESTNSGTATKSVATTKLIPLSTVTSLSQVGKPLLKQITKVAIPGGGKTFAIPVATTNLNMVPKTVQVNTKIIPLKTAEQAATPTTEQSVNLAAKEEQQTSSSPTAAAADSGIKTRKPCNCSKSQCLKLYCECFANGEFCYMCNCVNCYNNLQYEEHRQRAIKNCLERNPNAFRPKIGKGKDMGEIIIRKHTKGCNCKRSGCLKNYCECYEAKIMCSSNCKCMGCKNVENPIDVPRNKSNEYRYIQQLSPQPSVGRSQSLENVKLKRNTFKQAFNYITNEVIEATTQCLLTMAKNAEEMGQDEKTTQKEIIEEYGRCLKQIIDCSLSKSVEIIT